MSDRSALDILRRTLGARIAVNDHHAASHPDAEARRDARSRAAAYRVALDEIERAAAEAVTAAPGGGRVTAP